MLSDKQPIVEKGQMMIDYEIERRKANAKKEVWKAVQKAYEEIDKATEKAIEDIASFRNNTIRCDG